MTTILVAFLVLFVLLFLGMPIGLAMGLVGVAGFASVSGWQPSLAMLSETAVSSVMSYSFSVVPMFLLMGNLVLRSGLADDLYKAANAFLGHFRGGLALSTIVACGGFGSVCGSSVATAATMTRIAVPSMRQYGYSSALAASSVAAGGTLGILIPPSVPLAVYGLITENDIGKLFIAGIIPGVVGIFGYMLAVWFTMRFRPDWGPPADRIPWPERWASLKRLWSVAALFLLVVGGIYGHAFTPIEASGVGALGALITAFARKGIGLKDLVRDLLVDTVATTASLFLILIGALVFANFVTIVGVPKAFGDAIDALALPPYGLIILILAIYLVLGCFVESMAMMLLTVPVFYPAVLAAGFDPIWFGIVVIIAIELSLITPPVGMNIFVVKSMVSGLPLRGLYGGLVPFIASDMVRMGLIVAAPIVVLVLPNLMG